MSTINQEPVSDEYAKGKAKLVKELSNLPDELTDAYEIKLTELFYESNRSSLIEQLLSILEGPHDEDIRYGAFYCLHIIYRRSRQKDELGELFAKYGDQFKGRETFEHLRIMLDLEGCTDQTWESIVEDAYRNSQKFPRHGGIVHLFAVAVATAWEKSNDPAEREAIVTQWMEEAKKAADRAIKLRKGYAKFYSTRARLYAIQGDYDQALADLDEAVRQEDRSTFDYPIRLGDYYSYRFEYGDARRTREMEEIRERATKIIGDLENTESTVRELKNDVVVTKEQIERSAAANTEFLALFAGVVAFIAASTNIMAEVDAVHVAKLIVILMGALLIAFSGLGYMLALRSVVVQEETIRHLMVRAGRLLLPVVILGIVSIVGGFALGGWP